jgi:predicted dehydrogenase
MARIRWGILSTARIARQHVIPALQHAPHAEVSGLASRELARAQTVARAFDIPKAYDSYAALLADPDIDAVYIPLPNDQHVPWSLAALEAGKHVLCEKPIGMSAREGEWLLEATTRYPRLKVMEAFMYRFHPQWQSAKALVADGAIGELRSIHSFFAYLNMDPANIRNQLAHGGGGLMDIGCYCISLSRWLFGAEPQRTWGFIEYDPTFSTDRLASAVLDFGRGTATFTCSTQIAPFQRVQIFGTRGHIELEVPVNAPRDRPARIWHAHDDAVDEIQFEPVDQYALLVEAFAQAILEDTPVPTPLEDAVNNMRVIDALILGGGGAG